MTLVAGASRFLNQSTLTNQQGFAAQSSNLLGVAAGSTGILDIGRNLEIRGVGISNRARNLNRQFLESTSGTYNQLFSASGGGSATVEGALTQIKALQSSVPTSRDSPQVREAAFDAQEAAAVAEKGSIIDEEV
ncbi:MAG: hypothetical protein ACRBDI_01510 [Alphaproteobacteria bacterium]